eukprot:scaffold5706_cov151-Cylindrotheca_fusiformis.AAC.3
MAGGGGGWNIGEGEHSRKRNPIQFSSSIAIGLGQHRSSIISENDRRTSSSQAFCRTSKAMSWRVK